MRSKYVAVPGAVITEAMGGIPAPCCGGAGDCCPDYDPRRAAVEAGYVAGVREARRRIADRIRAELVCCPPETIDRFVGGLGGEPRTGPDFHDICFWGEMGARLAEDPHSMMDHPYECMSPHPGECWNPDNPPRDERGVLLP